MVATIATCQAIWLKELLAEVTGLESVTTRVSVDEDEDPEEKEFEEDEEPQEGEEDMKILCVQDYHSFLEKKEKQSKSIMSTPLTQAAIRRMIKESINAAIAAERARHANAGNDARGSRPVRVKMPHLLFVSALLLGYEVQSYLLHGQ
ncbi:hypothetical protein Tco_0843361 [Tanacetum coccineum]|uniref:Uncharacterized protein n=1 Tax=Tanacetum coccineum TaxID=301880 RepID=A0ABQ5B3M8_9ASTR